MGRGWDGRFACLSRYSFLTVIGLWNKYFSSPFLFFCILRLANPQSFIANYPSTRIVLHSFSNISLLFEPNPYIALVIAITPNHPTNITITFDTPLNSTSPVAFFASHHPTQVSHRYPAFAHSPHYWYRYLLLHRFPPTPVIVTRSQGLSSAFLLPSFLLIRYLISMYTSLRKCNESCLHHRNILTIDWT